MRKIISFFAFVAIVLTFAACGGNEPEVIVQGEFTVGNGKQVYFSKANLKVTYSGSNRNWSFLDHQWDVLGKYSPEGVDLFGWSTFSTIYGLNASEANSTYSGEFYDWGHIFPGEGWRTLSSGEWLYLFHERPMAEVMFAFGRIILADESEMNGIIILPDNWTKPAGISFTPSTQCEDPALGKVVWDGSSIEYINPSFTDANYEHNIYTLAQWTRMENAGAVFLPAAGFRIGTLVESYATSGNYWASDENGDDAMAFYVYFNKNKLSLAVSEERHYGQSVRLVKNVE